MYADGYNNENRKTIVLSLQDVDKHILETFNQELKTDKPLQLIKRNHKNINWKDHYRLSIISENISLRLKKLGCSQKKSFIIQFPNDEIVPKNLLRHFIRGYFDGDGTFGTYRVKNKYKAYNFCIVSTEKFCSKLALLIKDLLGITSYLEIRHKNRNNATRQLRISGRKQIYKFLDWIYKDATIYLERKYQKYLQEKL